MKDVIEDVKEELTKAEFALSFHEVCLLAFSVRTFDLKHLIQ